MEDRAHPSHTLPEDNAMMLTRSCRRTMAGLSLLLFLPLSDALAQTDALPTVTNYGTACHGMSLTTDELPDVTTAPFNFLVTGIPAGSIANAIFWNFAPTPGPMSLAFIGAPACFLLVDQPVLYASNLTPIGTADSFTSGLPNFRIYNAAVWIGVTSFFQAASLIPGINPGSIATSDGVQLVGG